MSELVGRLNHPDLQRSLEKSRFGLAIEAAPLLRGERACRCRPVMAETDPEATLQTIASQRLHFCAVIMYALIRPSTAPLPTL